jgi:CMP-N-acetylneuraminic acid synthetase
MKNIIIIPARNGSQRLKNKNLLKIKNKTLVEWTIDFSKKIQKVDKIIVSSDNKEILDLAKNYAKIFFHRRPKYLSKNNSLITTVVKYLDNILGKKFINIMLLQPTSPYRSIKDINNQWLKFLNLKKKYKSIASVSMGKNNEKKNFKIIKNILTHEKSNKNKEFYQANGNFFIANMNSIKRYNKFIVSDKTIASVTKIKKNFIDIDIEKDYKEALRLCK